MTLIFVDCEANGPSVSTGELTEFGAVEFQTKKWFHGITEENKIKTRVREYRTRPDCLMSYVSTLGKGTLVSNKPEGSVVTWGDHTFNSFLLWIKKFDPPYIFVSDNPAYDWQWINDGFHILLGCNPFGHSARRIGDFYAGLIGNWRAASKWKKFRRTPHDHNPVHDAIGNVEAFEEILKRYPWVEERFNAES